MRMGSDDLLLIVMLSAPDSVRNPGRSRLRGGRLGVYFGLAGDRPRAAAHLQGESGRSGKRTTSG